MLSDAQAIRLNVSTPLNPHPITTLSYLDISTILRTILLITATGPMRD